MFWPGILGVPVVLVEVFFFVTSAIFRAVSLGCLYLMANLDQCIVLILPFPDYRLVTDMEQELSRYQQQQQRYDQPPQLTRQEIHQLVGRDPLQPQARLPGNYYHNF
jgi:hypothetical protein